MDLMAIIVIVLLLASLGLLAVLVAILRRAANEREQMAARLGSAPGKR